MEKNYNSRDPKKMRERIEKLSKEEFRIILENHEINSLENVEICDLAEFLIIQHPEKYAKTAGIEMDYRRDENLRNIYAVINKEKNMAVMINTEEGKIPKGQFGVYDLQNHKFQASEAMEYKIRKTVHRMANGTLTAKEEDELVDKISPKNLDSMEKIATIDFAIEKRTRKAIDKKVDEKNKENGITEEERKEVEESGKNVEKSKGKSQKISSENDRSSKSKIPGDVENACNKLGITHIKSYFYVNAKQFDDKIDGTKTNQNDGRVLILEVSDSSRIGINRYFGIQNNRIVLWGNEDNAVSRIVPSPLKDGKYIEPLKEDNPTYVEYENSDGLVIREKLEDKSDVSVQEKEDYQEKVVKLLERYSNKVMKIEESGIGSIDKQELLGQADEEFDREFEKMSSQTNIDKSDFKNIKAEQDEYAEEEMEEQEEAARENNEYDEEWEAHRARVKKK